MIVSVCVFFVCECVYMCVCVCPCVWMCLFVYLCVHVCICVCESVCVYVSLCMFMCVCIYVSMCVSTLVCLYVCSVACFRQVDKKEIYPYSTQNRHALAHCCVCLEAGVPVSHLHGLFVGELWTWSQLSHQDLRELPNVLPPHSSKLGTVWKTNTIVYKNEA